MNAVRPQRGFTLLEMSIVLAIIAIVIGMSAQMGVSVIATAHLSATQKKMKALDDALMAFRTGNDRLPCPGDLTITQGTANYGVEAGAGTGSAIGVGTGVCTGTGMLPQAKFTGAGVTNTSATAAEGAVPTASLGLPNDFMYDGWGNHFRYAVDISMTKPGAFTGKGLACSPTGPITVNDVNAVARSTGAIYALISHGPNGHGAYTSNGVILNAGSVNANEQTNCNCTSTGTANTYAPTYVQMNPTLSATNPLNSFDDLVTYKERWQMPAVWDTAKCTFQYIYVTDNGVQRTEKFDTSGNYISQWSTGLGPFGAATDGSGNVYVPEWDSCYVGKYDANGNPLLSVGAGFNGVAGSQYSCGSANGQFYGPWDVAVDGNGNIWVPDYWNNRVQEFNSSGAWIRSIGGPSPYTCETSPAASPPACASGGGNGQFSAPLAIAVDRSGNVWVVDGDRVEEFNSSGVYQGQFGSYGTANGQFIGASGIATDGSGNLWVADGGWNRVEELNSSGTFLLGIGSGYNGVAGSIGQAGTGNGQFTGVGHIAIDPSGNVWVVDGNNRVQEFSNSGAWMFSFGGTASACTSCGCTGPAACPANSGSGNGQFNGPRGIALH